MSDFYAEWIVKRETPKKVLVHKILLIVAAVLVLILIPIPAIGILAAIGVIAFMVFYGRSCDIEWEYSLVQKTLYVDKIMSKSRRKRAGEYDLSKVEVMAPSESYRIKEYAKRNLKVVDYSTLIPSNPKYVAIVMDNNEMVQLVLEPTEGMLKELRNIIPRQLFND